MSFAHLAWMPILLSMSAAYGECTLDAPADALMFVHRHMIHNFNADPPDWMEDELSRAVNAASSPTAIAVLPWPDDGALTTRRGWAVINVSPEVSAGGRDVFCRLPDVADYLAAAGATV